MPTISGGNIEVKVNANSISQAAGIIRTLPYFKNFIKQPVQEGTKDNNLTEIRDLIRKDYAK